MSHEFVSLEKDGGVAVVTMNRPDAMNAMNMELLGELEAALRAVARDPSVRCMVLTGAGSAFSAGGDVKDMASAQDAAGFLRDLSRSIHRCVLEIRGMPFPVIGAMNGMAVGAGLGLLLSSDVIAAREGARMKAGFTSVGLAPGCGTWFIPKMTGYHRAANMIFADEPVDAGTAMEWGLVNYIWPAEEYDEKVNELAGRFAAGPTVAFGRAKHLLNLSYGHPLAAHMEQESVYLSLSGETDDFREGVVGFGEKRKPSFSGR